MFYVESSFKKIRPAIGNFGSSVVDAKSFVIVFIPSACHESFISLFVCVHIKLHELYSAWSRGIYRRSLEFICPCVMRPFEWNLAAISSLIFTFYCDVRCRHLRNERLTCRRLVLRCQTGTMQWRLSIRFNSHSHHGSSYILSIEQILKVLLNPLFQILKITKKKNQDLIFPKIFLSLFSKCI